MGANIHTQLKLVGIASTSAASLTVDWCIAVAMSEESLFNEFLKWKQAKEADPSDTSSEAFVDSDSDYSEEKGKPGVIIYVAYSTYE